MRATFHPPRASKPPPIGVLSTARHAQEVGQPLYVLHTDSPAGAERGESSLREIGGRKEGEGIEDESGLSPWIHLEGTISTDQ